MNKNNDDFLDIYFKNKMNLSNNSNSDLYEELIKKYDTNNNFDIINNENNLYLGYLYYKLKKFKLAEKYIGIISKYDTKAKYILGFFYKLQKNIKLMNKYLIKAINSDLNIMIYKNIKITNNIDNDYIIIYTIIQNNIELYEKYFEIMLKIKNNENDINILLDIGIYYINSNNNSLNKLGEKHLLKVIELDQNNSMVLYKLGEYYIDKQQDYIKGIKYLNLSINYNNICAYYKLGKYYHEKKNIELSKYYFILGINYCLNTNSIEESHKFYNILATIYFSCGDLKKTIHYLSRDPNPNQSTLYNLGIYYENIKDNNSAYYYYKMATIKGHKNAIYKLAKLYHIHIKNYILALYYYKMYHITINNINNNNTDKLISDNIVNNDAIINTIFSLYFNNIKDYKSAEKYISESTASNYSLFYYNFSKIHKYIQIDLNNSKDNICNICYSNVYIDDVFCKYCKKLYCFNCIFNWTHTYNHSCPICRKGFYDDIYI